LFGGFHDFLLGIHSIVIDRSRYDFILQLGELFFYFFLKKNKLAENIELFVGKILFELRCKKHYKHFSNSCEKNKQFVAKP
jgi:hypothetical protein